MCIPKAAIITVGSELLAGQITNRNAAWLAERLTTLGLTTVAHVTVDDRLPQIQAYLEFVAQEADLIFVTGGLGPTSDDLTRDAVSAWTADPLVFHAPSWQHVQQHFAQLNLNLPASNRQQCYFPSSARVLVNNRGTANAFSMRFKQHHLWVLPGPPQEIEALWPAIETEVAALVPGDAKLVTRLWRTIGRGESAIAELVESVAAGKGLTIAYRAHAPLIETKLSYTGSPQRHFAELFKAVDEKLSPWLYERDDQDTVAQLARWMLTSENVVLYDGLSRGYIQEILAPHLRNGFGKNVPCSLLTTWEEAAEPQEFLHEYLSWHDDAELILALAGYNQQDQWAIGVKYGEHQRFQILASPYRGEAQRERNRKAVGALAMKFWCETLSPLNK